VEEIKNEYMVIINELKAKIAEIEELI